MRSIAPPELFRELRGLIDEGRCGFYNALEDVRPERAFVVYAGTERYPLSREVEVIGVREMAEVLRGV